MNWTLHVYLNLQYNLIFVFFHLRIQNILLKIQLHVNNTNSLSLSYFLSKVTFSFMWRFERRQERVKKNLQVISAWFMSRDYAGICIVWYMYPSHKFLRALSTFSMYMYVFYVCEYNWLRYVLKVNPTLLRLLRSHQCLYQIHGLLNLKLKMVILTFIQMNIIEWVLSREK